MKISNRSGALGFACKAAQEIAYSDSHQAGRSKGCIRIDTPDQAERLSAAMNQPITREGGMTVDCSRNEPAEWPDVWEWIGDMTKAAPWVAGGIAVVVALLWAIYQLWPVLVVVIGI